MTKRMSPVVYAECRYAGGPVHFHVGVWFNNKQELDGLISALAELRETIDDDFDHIHLQQHGLSGASPIGHAEIVFFRPSRPIQDIERDGINDASNWITAAISGKQ